MPKRYKYSLIRVVSVDASECEKLFVSYMLIEATFKTSIALKYRTIKTRLSLRVIAKTVETGFRIECILWGK